MVNRFGTAPNSLSALSTSRGRQRQRTLPSRSSEKIASSNGGIGGGGALVDGLSSVSQLPDAVKIARRSTSSAADDHTLEQPLREKGKSQPGRERKPVGSPSSTSLW